MISVVKYNIYRLFKNKLAMILLVVGIIAGGVGTALAQRYGNGSFDFSLLIITVVLPTIIYTDYKDGLIRNKIMAGNDRKSIYAANLISNSVISVLYWLVYQAVSISLMNIMPGTALLTGAHAIIYLAVGIVAIIAICSIFTLIAVNVRSHYSLIICIVVYFAMIMLCGSFMNWTAKPSVGEGVKKFLLVLYRIIPAGQFTLLETAQLTDVWLLPILSVALIALMTCIGVVLFGKKDLK